MKKLIPAVSSVFLLCILATPNTARAAGNNSFATAQTIALKTAIYDSLVSSSNALYYKFTLNAPGYIHLTFRHDIMESDVNYWQAQIYNSSYEEITARRFTGRIVKASMPQIGLSAGTYFIKISAGLWYSGLTYNFTVNYTQSPVWEREFNDTFQTSTAIALNTAYYGSIRSSSDIDYYKFTLNAPGYIHLTFRHDIMESDVNYWQAQIYNSSYEEMAAQRFTGRIVKASMPQIGLSAGTYFIKISAGLWYSDITYNFTVGYGSAAAAPKGRVVNE